MKVYHFTARHLLAGCLNEGLTKGMIPLFDDVGNPYVAPGWQWVTTNPNWDQAWDSGTTLPYSRTAHRLTVKVPKAHGWRLHRWRRVVPGYMAEVLGAEGDPENWLLFHGRIKPAWIWRVDNCPTIYQRGRPWAMN
jgi:hypothetical protein